MKEMDFDGVLIAGAIIIVCVFLFFGFTTVVKKAFQSAPKIERRDKSAEIDQRQRQDQIRSQQKRLIEDQRRKMEDYRRRRNYSR